MYKKSFRVRTGLSGIKFRSKEIFLYTYTPGWVILYNFWTLQFYLQNLQGYFNKNISSNAHFCLKLIPLNLHLTFWPGLTLLCIWTLTFAWPSTAKLSLPFKSNHFLTENQLNRQRTHKNNTCALGNSVFKIRISESQFQG